MRVPGPVLARGLAPGWAKALPHRPIPRRHRPPGRRAKPGLQGARGAWGFRRGSSWGIPVRRMMGSRGTPRRRQAWYPRWAPCGPPERPALQANATHAPNEGDVHPGYSVAELASSRAVSAGAGTRISDSVSRSHVSRITVNDMRNFQCPLRQPSLQKVLQKSGPHLKVPKLARAKPRKLQRARAFHAHIGARA